MFLVPEQLAHFLIVVILVILVLKLNSMGGHVKTGIFEKIMFVKRKQSLKGLKIASFENKIRYECARKVIFKILQICIFSTSTNITRL